MNLDNQKPAVWVGHVAIHTTVVARSCEFMQSIGMRLIMLEEEFALLNCAVARTWHWYRTRIHLSCEALSI